ncbi:MAG: hypothetical protein GY863_10480, partial [bacterium]|nr:hypothetical protein [bacterium]
MKPVMKYKIPVIVLITAFLCFTMSIDLMAQRRRPTRRIPVRVDTTRAGDSLRANTEQATLPTLDLREYTITGKNRIRILPSQRRAIEMADITKLERNSAVEGKTDRTAPGAGGNKIEGEGVFDMPMTGVVNEVYGSFGKYTDVNLGAKLRKNMENDELFIDLDANYNKGHIERAGYNYLKGNFANLHRFSNHIMNKSQLSLNWYDYQFYGAYNPEKSRQGYYLDFSSVTDYTRFSPTNIRFEGGGRYADPDDSEIFNWDLWGRLSWSSILWKSFLKGTVEGNTDRVKDASSGNAPLSTGNYFKALITVERLLTDRLHIKLGGAFYQYMSENANTYFRLEAGEWTEKMPVLIKREDNFFVPNLAVRYDMGEAGRLFVEFEPSVEPVSLMDKIKFNPYLKLTSPLSYENYSHDTKIGWRRSYVYDLSFEVYYSDKKIENYGIPDDTDLPGYELNKMGQWNLIYDNVVDLNEYRATVNWNPHPKFNFWTAFSYTDYDIDESDFAVRLPYFPDYTIDFSMQAFPGYGIQMVLDGQYISKRYVSAFDIAGGDTELDPYILSNLTI